MQLGQTKAIWISPFCMGLLCALSCVSSLALPNTKDVPLLLNIQTAEVFYTKERSVLSRALRRNKIASESWKSDQSLQNMKILLMTKIYCFSTENFYVKLCRNFLSFFAYFCLHVWIKLKAWRGLREAGGWFDFFLLDRKEKTSMKFINITLLAAVTANEGLIWY